MACRGLQPAARRFINVFRRQPQSEKNDPSFSLGLSRDANAPAVGVAVCISLIAVLCLARIPTDWKSAVTKSIFGLFTLTLGVVGAVYFFR